MTLRHTYLKHILIAAAAIVTMASVAKDEFTAHERQQISIATPGLFSRSEAFTVDFASLSDKEYSFPLPVGKAERADGNALEIETKKGDAVKAVFAGTVRLSRQHPTYGNVIVVRHDNGLETVYGHNAQNLVKVGDRVKAGQTVAIVGGKDGKCFCLFAIMINGARINPEMILGIVSHKLHKQTILCKKKGGSVEMTVINREEDETAKRKKDVDYNANPFEKANSFTLNLPELGADQWCYPLPAAKVISPYGRRNGRSHTGVDIKTKANDKIMAAFDGMVTMAQPYHAYGNLIRIKHANGIETLYSHNSKNLVKKGDIVKAGQVIALTGRTGRATTEHLHFECRVNGQTFDPAKIFDHSNHSVKENVLTFTKRGGSVSIRTDKKHMAKGTVAKHR